jgi:tyrosyl-tRNA synthetase
MEKKKQKKPKENFNTVFRNKEVPSDIAIFQAEKQSYPVLDLLFDAKLAESKNDAKRVVEGGGVEIDNQKITDWKQEIQLRNGMIIKFGKRKFIKVKLK